jgi:hypothetical protein
MSSKQDADQSDVLKGAQRIAEFLGEDFTAPQVYYAVECGRLPVKRMGRTIIGSKSVLREFFTKSTEGTTK